MVAVSFGFHLSSDPCFNMKTNEMFYFADVGIITGLEYLTIIPRAHVGYEMIDSQRGAKLAVIISYPTSTSGIIVLLKTIKKCRKMWLVSLSTNNQKIAISRAWYNGSYTMAAKPIKSLDLHYTMIQFLIIRCIDRSEVHKGTGPSLPIVRTPSPERSHKS